MNIPKNLTTPTPIQLETPPSADDAPRPSQPDTHTTATDRGTCTPGPRIRATWLIGLLLVLCAGTGSAHYRSWWATEFDSESMLLDVWESLSLSHQDVQEWAATPDGEWVIVGKNRQVWFSSGFPYAARSTIQSFNSVTAIDAIAFSPDGEWAVAAGGYFDSSAGVPERDRLHIAVHNAHLLGGKVDELAFTADGDGWLVTADNWFTSHNCPPDLEAALSDLSRSDRALRHVNIGADGRWVLVADQWFASSAISARLHDRLQLWLEDGRRINRLMLGEDDDYLMYSHGNFSADRKIEKLENNLDGDNIFQRMEDADIAGISLAVIKDNKVKLARGYGTLEAGTQRWVRTDSPFDLASLSKFLGALTAMTVVEDGYIAPFMPIQHVATIAADPVLTDWIAAQPGGKVPGGIDLVHLLSHTASTVPHSSTSMRRATGRRWRRPPGIYSKATTTAASTRRERSGTTPAWARRARLTNTRAEDSCSPKRWSKR